MRKIVAGCFYCLFDDDFVNAGWLVQGALREWRGMIEKAVKKGQRAGEIRAGIS